MYFIIGWDISGETTLDGPYDTAMDAREKIADCREDYPEKVGIVGPLPFEVFEE